MGGDRVNPGHPHLQVYRRAEAGRFHPWSFPTPLACTLELELHSQFSPVLQNQWRVVSECFRWFQIYVHFYFMFNYGLMIPNDYHSSISFECVQRCWNHSENLECPGGSLLFFQVWTPWRELRYGHHHGVTWQSFLLPVLWHGGAMSCLHLFPALLMEKCLSHLVVGIWLIYG